VPRLTWSHSLGETATLTGPFKRVIGQLLCELSWPAPIPALWFASGPIHPICSTDTFSVGPRAGARPEQYDAPEQYFIRLPR
jgi:hypothetical protein